MSKYQKRSIINFSIKTGFQVRFMLKIMFAVLLGTLATSTVFYYYANQEIGATFKQFHINARTFLDYLLPAILASGILGGVTAFVIALFFPHSYAGPLYRIERDLKEKIGEKGDLTCRFKLRTGDEVKGLADSLNIMLEKIRSSIEDIDAASNDLLKVISDQKKPAIEELREIQKKLTETILKFKIH